MEPTTQCQVCQSNDLKNVLNLGSHPLCDDLIAVGQSDVCKEYPIEILMCKSCLTANQKYNVSKYDLFPEGYHYRARFTKDVLDGMKQLTDSIVKNYGSLEGKKVIDIGCNDGSLLSFFKEKNAIIFGVEPTNAHKEATHIENLWGTYFTQSLAKQICNDHGPMDYITFTNVFAHIEDFSDMLSAVKELMHPNTKIVIENHYLGAVMDHNQFDTFYHEHPRTYSFRSFEKIAELLGLKIEHAEFPKRYGGNIRVILGNGEVTQNIENKPDENNFFQQFESMAEFIEQWKVDKKQEIEKAVETYGPLTAKAFPGRAAILIKLLDLNHNHIKHVAEKPGSMKIGHYIPGTRIPIVSDDDIDYPSSSCVVNLAWHIRDEINSYITAKGFQGQRIDIL